MLLDGHINVLTSGHLQDSTLQRVLVALEPLGYVDHGSVFGGQALEAGGAAAAFLHLDHITHANQIGRNVDLLAVDGEVSVADQLTGLTAGRGEAQTIHRRSTSVSRFSPVLPGMAEAFS